MKKFSKKTINRAFLYIRTLEQLINNKHNLVSSGQLAKLTGLTSTQIRKDISNFGKVGTPGIGYNTEELNEKLELFILQKQVVHIAVFGIGNLGAAILKYPNFQKTKLNIVAGFDNDLKKVGKKFNSIPIHPIVNAPGVIKKTHTDIGIIAVPQKFAQEVADIMVLSGLKGILNFSPTTINVPNDVFVKDIDFTISILSLFCRINLT